jgi:hypothetical protein
LRRSLERIEKTVGRGGALGVRADAVAESRNKASGILAASSTNERNETPAFGKREKLANNHGPIVGRDLDHEGLSQLIYPHGKQKVEMSQKLSNDMTSNFHNQNFSNKILNHSQSFQGLAPSQDVKSKRDIMSSNLMSVSNSA